RNPLPLWNRARDRGTLQPARDGTPLAEGVGRTALLRARRRRPARSLLRARDVPLSVRSEPVTVERYNPREMEPHWQKVWEEQRSFVLDDADPRDPYYVLEMFPYPSDRSP